MFFYILEFLMQINEFIWSTRDIFVANIQERNRYNFNKQKNDHVLKGQACANDFWTFPNIVDNPDHGPGLLLRLRQVEQQAAVEAAAVHSDPDMEAMFDIAQNK